MKKIAIIISVLLILLLTGCSKTVDEQFINRLEYPDKAINWGITKVSQSYPTAPNNAQKIGDFYDYNAIKEIVFNNEYLSEHFVLGEQLSEGYKTSLSTNSYFLELACYRIVGVTKEHYNDANYMVVSNSFGPTADFEICVSSCVDDEGNQYFDIQLNMININDDRIQQELYSLLKDIVGTEISQTLIFGKFNNTDSKDQSPLFYESTEKNSKLLSLSKDYKYQYILERNISEETIGLTCGLMHVSTKEIEQDNTPNSDYCYDRLIDKSVQETLKTKPEDIYPDLKIQNINPAIAQDYFKEWFEKVGYKDPSFRTYTTHFETITIGEYKYDYRVSITPGTLYIGIYKNDELIYRKIRADGTAASNDPLATIEPIKEQLSLFFDLETIEGLDIDKAFVDWINDTRKFDESAPDDDINYEQDVIRNGIQETATFIFSPSTIYKDGDVYMIDYNRELDEVMLMLSFIYKKEVD